MGRQRTRRALATCVLAACLPRLTRAATDTFNGPTGNWSSNTWSLGHAPGANDAAILSNAGGSLVLVTLDTNATVNQLSIDSLASGTVSFQQLTNAFTTGNEYIGSARAGSLTFSGGAHTVNSDLYLGFGTAAAGSLSITGGSFAVPNGQLHVGYAGAGTINLSAGVLIATNGATFIGEQLSSSGAFNQSGGTFQAGALRIAAGGDGSYSMSNGAVLNVAASMFVGDTGTGTFSQIGGNTTIGQFLFVGQNGIGALALSGGSFSASNLATYVGVNAAGSINQTGGTMTAASLELGFTSGVSGQYTLANGSLRVTGDLFTGDSGLGTFNQSGGTASVSGTMFVGSSSIGNYLQNGGAASFGSMTLSGTAGSIGNATVAATANLHVTGTLAVGSAGNGSFSQSGGTVNASMLTVGDLPNSSGTAAISAGSLSITGPSNIGFKGNGNFILNGGSVTFAAALNVAARTGSTGNLTATAGSLTAPSLFLGGDSTTNGGAATLTVSNNASLTVAGPLTLYTNNANTTLNLTGGSISAGSLNLGGNLSRLHWSSGSLIITGSAGLLIDPSSPTGAAWPLNTGQSLTLSTTETISNGSFTQLGGTHTALVAIMPASTYTLSGGNFNGAMSVSGTLNASGGAFNGSLFVQSSGTAIVSGLLSPTLGSTIYGTALINPTGTLASNIDIEGGTLTLAGGALAGSTTNNGSITAFGLLSGGSLTNNGLFSQSTGNLTIQNSGPTLNTGSFNLAAGRQLILNSPFSNSGSMPINGAIITGAATLTNTPFGTLLGPGTIASPLANAGTLLVQPGTLNITASFTNTGLIQLNGIGSSLNTTALTNAGTLQGSGAVGGPITNLGTIEPLAGTLTFFSALTNSTPGILRVAAGNKLLLSGVTSATNAGTISLTGGTFDAGGATLINTGQITGYGTLATGSLINNPNAAITLAGGTATINGSLTNAPGGTVRISFTPAVFTGPVTNNGSVIVSSANVTFAAGFTNNGLYASDPSTTTAADITINPAGALIATAGDHFITSGNFFSTSTQRATWNTRDATLSFIAGGASTHVITISGDDHGATATGYEDNFAWGTLELSPGQSLTLEPTTAGEALYITTLQLDGVTSDLPTYIATHLINANPAHPANLYYDPTQPTNAYLADQTYPLANGGFLSPITAPEPSTTLLALTAAGLLRRRRTRGASQCSPGGAARL